MSALKDALREAADQAPTYPVVEAAIARGRRRRRASALTGAVSVLAVIALGTGLVAPLVGHHDAPVAEPPLAQVSLPERIGPPGWFVDDVGDAPGPASLIFSAGSGVISVGAAADSYHRVDAPGTDAGRDALLSPDGSRIAIADGVVVRVVDLRTGGTRTYTSPEPAASSYRPAAWLPDGHGLIVLTWIPAQDPTTQGISKRLGVLDLTTGALDTFADGTYPIAVAGFAVAVSPDGGRIAYQYEDFVTVFDRPTRAKTRFTVESDGILAGKGAWTPDGRSLAIMRRNVGDWEGRRWELRLVDPVTGRERDELNRPGMSGLSLMRLVGWYGPVGRPVVIGYHGDGEANGFGLVQGGDERLAFSLHSVGVYVITAAGPRALVEPVDGITAIDVAGSVLASGRTRPGNPPPMESPWLLAAVVIGGLALAVRFLVQRLRRNPT